MSLRFSHTRPLTPVSPPTTYTPTLHPRLLGLFSRVASPTLPPSSTPEFQDSTQWPSQAGPRSCRGPSNSLEASLPIQGQDHISRSVLKGLVPEVRVDNWIESGKEWGTRKKIEQYAPPYYKGGASGSHSGAIRKVSNSHRFSAPWASGFRHSLRKGCYPD